MIFCKDRELICFTFVNFSVFLPFYLGTSFSCIAKCFSHTLRENVKRTIEEATFLGPPSRSRMIAFVQNILFKVLRFISKVFFSFSYYIPLFIYFFSFMYAIKNIFRLVIVLFSTFNKIYMQLIFLLSLLSYFRKKLQFRGADKSILPIGINWQVD